MQKKKKQVGRLFSNYRSSYPELFCLIAILMLKKQQCLNSFAICITSLWLAIPKQS